LPSSLRSRGRKGRVFGQAFFEKGCGQAFFQKGCGQAFFEKGCGQADWFLYKDLKHHS
jgi:hypothetical protein